MAAVMELVDQAAELDTSVPSAEFNNKFVFLSYLKTKLDVFNLNVLVGSFLSFIFRNRIFRLTAEEPWSNLSSH